MITATQAEGIAEELLYGHVRDFVRDHTGSPALQVAWPNRKFEPAVGVAHGRVSILWGERTRMSAAFSGTYRHQGMLQLALMFPKDNTGSIRQSDLAGEFLAHTPEGLVLGPHEGVTVRVGRADGSTGTPYRASVVPEEVWLYLPIWVPWYILLRGR